MSNIDVKKYQEIYQDIVKQVFSVDSPTGFTADAISKVEEIVSSIGYPYQRYNKGTLVVTVDGADNSKTVALSSHVDTLGLMVRSISSSGELMITPIGGPLLPSLCGEYCRIYTRDGKQYTGTILSLSPSVHVFDDAKSRPRDERNLYVRIDEPVYSKEDVQKLGISAGDYICYDPKTTFTPSGYLKSRFIDDKGCASLLLTLLRMMHDNKIKPAYRTNICFTVFEEVGHGASALPAGISELLVVDMGCVGDDLSCTEQQVSICAKDSCGPYDYEMTTRLINFAKAGKLDYAVDIYPHYGSDAAAYQAAGNDTKAALIGPGVQASHGMERTHLDGLMNTLKLIMAYLNI
jgi:putative aminopeptidase FrvX